MEEQTAYETQGSSIKDRGSRSVVERVVPLPAPYYQEANITIYHADCSVILPHLQINAFVTDPPYGTGWINGGQKQGVFKAKTEKAEWDKWDDSWLDLIRYERLVCFAPDQRLVDLGQRHPLYRLRYYIKTNPRPALGGKDSPSVEPIFLWPGVVDSKGKAHKEAYNSRGTYGHPCEKPLEIVTWLVSDCTKPGDIICDPFMGTGTTLVAAKLLNRTAIGIESNKKWCDIAVDRLRQGCLLL